MHKCRPSYHQDYLSQGLSCSEFTVVFYVKVKFGNKFLQIFYGAFAFRIGALNLESNSLTLFVSIFFFSGNVNQYSGAHNNLGLGNESLILK